MGISTNCITVEYNLHAVENKAEVEKEALIEESNIKYVFSIVFEYAGIQNSMGAEFERNKFDANLKFIEKWIQKLIGQIEVSQTHEYKAQEAKKRRQFEGAMSW